MMKCGKEVFNKRKAIFLENDKIKVVVLLGGGHIAEIKLKDNPVSPLLVPPWLSIDPSDYKPSIHEKVYGKNNEDRLLASISGHNICLDFFGAPSQEEYSAGMKVHGEGPVVMWRIKNLKNTKSEAMLFYGAYLPVAQLNVNRIVRLVSGESVIYIEETIENTSASDRPICVCQHVTMGPPFLEKGITLFDMPAKWSKVAPFNFGPNQRFKMGKEFMWPNGPSSKGHKINLRPMPSEKKSGDFTTHQFNRKLKYAWFTAVNPKQGVCFGYVFKREDFPWMGNWEENYSRAHKPWNSRSLARGMEFSTSPFPISKRESVDMGQLHGDKTFRWIPAKSSITYNYASFIFSVEQGFSGVKGLKVVTGALKIIPRGSVAPFTIKASRNKS